MTFRCNLTEADYRAFDHHNMWRYQKTVWGFVSFAILFSVVFWFDGKSRDLSIKEKIESIFVLFVSVAAFYSIVFLVTWPFVWLFRRLTRYRWRDRIGERVYDISADEVKVSSKNGKMETPISALLRVDETRRHFLIIIKDGWWHIIPKRDLSDLTLQALRELQSRVRANAAPKPNTPRPLGLKDEV